MPSLTNVNEWIATIDEATKSKLEAAAFDATIGCGDDSERVDITKAERALRRVLADHELEFFRREWKKNLQMMGQP